MNRSGLLVPERTPLAIPFAKQAQQWVWDAGGFRR